MQVVIKLSFIVMLIFYRSNALLRSCTNRCRIRKQLLSTYKERQNDEPPSSSSSPSIDSGRQQDYSYHIPVLRDECLNFLQIKPNGVYVDCTLGGGGHTLAILEAGGSVIGFDQDPDAIAKASLICQDYIKAGKLEIFQSNFRNFADIVIQKSVLAAAKGMKVDGILMDLGISSHQINEPLRGFAFGSDGPLDMRMSKGEFPLFASSKISTLTASTIVNEYDADVGPEGSEGDR